MIPDACSLASVAIPPSFSCRPCVHLATRLANPNDVPSFNGGIYMANLLLVKIVPFGGGGGGEDINLRSSPLKREEEER